MADLVLEAQFKADQAQLKEFNKRLKEGEGIVNQLDMRLKVLRAQIRLSTDPADIKRFTSELNATHAKLDAVNKAAGRFGSSGLDKAFERAGKKLFDLGNILKASVGFLGVAGIAGSFVQATGAAEAMDKAVKSLVDGFINLGNTNIQNLLNQTDELFKNIKATQEELIKSQIWKLENTKEATVETFGSQFFGLQPDKRPLTEEEKTQLRNDIFALKAELNISENNERKKNLEKQISDRKKAELEYLAWFEKNIIDAERDKRLKNAELYNRQIYDIDGVRYTEEEMARIRKIPEAKKPVFKESVYEKNYYDDATKRHGDFLRKKEQAAKDSEERIQSNQIAFARNFTDTIGQSAASGFKNIEQLWKQMLQRMLAEAISASLLSFLFPAKAASGAFGFFGGLFAEGGYTGRGGKYEEAGIVHKGEIVWSQQDVQKFGGVRAVESIRPTAGKQRSMGGNYFNGGEVVPTSRQPIPEIIFRPIIKFDGLDIAYNLERPNGGYEKLNRMRASPE